MAYSELIKNFDRVRDFIREFYVYGFRNREEIGSRHKSPRTYDDEKRRIESYLADYMSYHRTSEGKTVFLSIDARTCEHNPLYAAFKAKSFTDGDITLHFLLFDLLAEGNQMTANELAEGVSDLLGKFDPPMELDLSTLRKKADEYVKLGLLQKEKKGKNTVYSRTWVWDIADLRNAIAYFSESAMLGEVGSFLLDKLPVEREKFSYKHKYIAQVLDDEILCTLLQAMHEKRQINFTYRSVKGRGPTEVFGVPLCIYVSVQNGRRSLILALNGRKDNVRAYRLDYVKTVNIGEEAEQFNELREALSAYRNNMWGVNCFPNKKLEHVEFTVSIGDDEEYIFNRLQKEKRCGTVERMDEHTARFTADVYDAEEMIPWVRSFTGRIIRMNFSDRNKEHRIMQDFASCLALYNGEVSP